MMQTQLCTCRQTVSQTRLLFWQALAHRNSVVPCLIPAAFQDWLEEEVLSNFGMTFSVLAFQLSSYGTVTLVQPSGHSCVCMTCAQLRTTNTGSPDLQQLTQQIPA